MRRGLGQEGNLKAASVDQAGEIGMETRLEGK